MNNDLLSLANVRRAPRAAYRRVRDRVQRPKPLAGTTLLKAALAARARLEPIDLTRLRVAVVKADTYADLFCCPPSHDATELVLSTRMRSGPVALYTETQCTGLIVKHHAAWSDRFVEQRVRDCNHRSRAHFLTEVPTLRARDPDFADTGRQADFAVDSSSVDWAQFDLVIAMDACVPEEVTRAFGNTSWAYFIGEPCMREYQKSSRRPLSGYQWFLNQRFRAIDTSRLRSHEIEFPYYLQYPGCLREVIDTQDAERYGVTLEHHSGEMLNATLGLRLERFGAIRTSSGSPREILTALHSSKYFVRLGGRRLWGNALIEAVAAGSLVVGDSRAFVHRDIFTAHTSGRSPSDILNRIEVLEQDPARFAIELAHQRRLVQFLAYDRPMLDLVTKTGRLIQDWRHPDD